MAEAKAADEGQPTVVLPLSTPLDQGTGDQADNYLAQRNAPTVIDGDAKVAVTLKPAGSPAGSVSPFAPKPPDAPAAPAAKGGT